MYFSNTRGYPLRWPILDHSARSEEHTSELQSLRHLVCRLLLEKITDHSRPKRTPVGRPAAMGCQAGEDLLQRIRAPGVIFFKPCGHPQALISFPPEIVSH